MIFALFFVIDIHIKISFLLKEKIPRNKYSFFYENFKIMQSH